MDFMRRPITIALLLAFAMAVTAQSAMKVLDKTASSIRKAGDVQVKFAAATFVDGVEQTSTEGVMLLRDKSMQLTTPEMRMWYDGHTQWSMINESGEVNVTNPTEREMAAINPYTFISHYKKGYRLSMKESTLRGQATYEVHMLATKPDNPAQEIYVDVARADHMPLCIRIRQGKEWNRITIKSLQGGMKLADSDFVFPSSEYRDVEVIDLR